MSENKSNPQVTISHAEYQELLEAEKALEALEEAVDKGESTIIKVETNYHSRRNHDRRDFYFVANPDDLTKLLTEKLEKLISEVEAMRESYVGCSFIKKKGIYPMIQQLHDKAFPSK